MVHPMGDKELEALHKQVKEANLRVETAWLIIGEVDNMVQNLVKYHEHQARTANKIHEKIFQWQTEWGTEDDSKD